MKSIVGKGDIAQNEQYHLFPQCFPKVFFFNVLTSVYMKERVKEEQNYVSRRPAFSSYRVLYNFTGIFHRFIFF